jgi:hypothetical protein
MTTTYGFEFARPRSRGARIARIDTLATTPTETPPRFSALQSRSADTTCRLCGSLPARQHRRERPLHN